MLRDLSVCRIEHDGIFLDLGDESSLSHRAYRFGPFPHLSQTEEGGARHTRFTQRRVHYDVWLTEPLTSAHLTLRARAGISRGVTAILDNRRLGTLRPSATGFQDLTFPRLPVTLPAGRHRITLQWSGRGGISDRAYGFAEWLHLGARAMARGDSHTPPVRSALRSDVVLNEKPHASLVLDDATRVACPLRLATDAKLSVQVGMWGTGQGNARVAVRTTRGSTQVVADRRVAGGNDARWSRLEVDLSKWKDQPIYLELSGHRSEGEGLVAFGEPKLSSSRVQVQPADASVVVVVVAAGLHRDLLPPFPAPRLSALQRVIESGTRFTDYRAPTTRAAGVLASLLSGTSPLRHGLDRRNAQLSTGLPSLATELLGRSGESALLTSVPQTRAAFGFARDFHHFEEFSPVADLPATAPFVRGADWLRTRHQSDPEPRRLLILHSRGAHPPWDLSKDQVQSLPPEDYHGILEARRGGLILSAMRHRSRRSARRLSSTEWTRLRALQAAALQDQDSAFGEILEDLDKLDLWERAMVVFVGDVASGEPPEAPFGDGRAPEEQLLNTPLWIKFPGNSQTEESSVPIDTMDLAHSIASALGLSLPTDRQFTDLNQVAHGRVPLIERPRMASSDQSYSIRWGNDVLYGNNPETPRLCRLDVDPRCSVDLLAERPLTAEALWRYAYVHHERGARASGGKTAPPALLDRKTAAALKVWGD